MISGRLKHNYTLEEILSHHTEYEIFRHYIGDFKLGDAIENPWESQRTPSFVVNDKGGFLSFRDFSNEECKGNIVELLKRVHPGKKYWEILEAVAKDMGTGNMKRPNLSPPKRRSPSFIQVTQKPFDTADLEYWKGYYQSKRDLEENDIYAVKSYRVNGTRYDIPSTELAYGYLQRDEEGEVMWKVYRPFAKNKKDKWRYSGKNTYIHGLENMKISGKGIIAKSVKDYLVFRKLIKKVCATSSESLDCFTTQNVEIINHCPPEWTYIAFDNDEAGRKARSRVCSAFGFSYIQTEDGMLPIKDFADMAKEKGLSALEQFLKLKNII